MLNDFLSIERLFGEDGAALYIEEVLNKYGEGSLNEALKSGHIITRTINIGPDSGRTLCWLSDEGRNAALSSGDTQVVRALYN